LSAAAEVASAAATVARGRKGPWLRPRKRRRPSRRLADTGRTVPVPVPAPVGPRRGRIRHRPVRSVAWETVRRTTFAAPPAKNSSPGRSCSTWWTAVAARSPSSAALGCRRATSTELSGAACPSGTDGAAGSAGAGVPVRRCRSEPRRTAPVEGTVVAAVAGTVVAAVAGTVGAAVAVADEADAVVAATGAPGTGAGAAVAGTRIGADTVCGAGPAARASVTRRLTRALTWSH